MSGRWRPRTPKWWTLPTFRYEERRWSDQGGGSAFDRARRVALALWPFVAMTAAMAVVVAAMAAFVNIADQRDKLAAVARDAKVASESNTALLAELKPCDPGDHPDSPACQRERRMAEYVDDTVGRINEALAVGLAAHDLNTHLNHEELRRRLAVPPSALTRTPITPATPTTTTTTTQPPPDGAPAVVPETTTTAPATTTTTCPRLPNGKCRP